MRGRHGIKHISIIALVVVATLTLPKPSYAGIGVEPTIIELVVSPAITAKGAYKVVNNGDSPIHVKVEPEDWLKVRTGVSAVPLKDWLTITPVEFDVEPHGSKDVEYAISPPKDYKGELIAMVFFASSSLSEGFRITSRIGASIYAAMENTIELDCEIKNVSIHRNLIKAEDGTSVDKGIAFTLDVENRGNVHLRPTGMIIIKGDDGSEYDLKIERGFPVYPKKNLSYMVNWYKQDIPAGNYDAIITLDYGNIYNIDKKIERRTSFSVEKDGKISF